MQLFDMCVIYVFDICDGTVQKAITNEKKKIEMKRYALVKN